MSSIWKIYLKNMKEEFAKMSELLRSKDLADVELGWLLINNYVKANRPSAVSLEKGKSYFITRVNSIDVYRDVQVYQGREKLNSINVLHVVDRMNKHWSIREHWILEIVPHHLEIQ